MGQYFDTIYYCSECKRVVKSLEDLLFIEEYSHKGFCTESCIEDFYLPLIKYFEVLENKLRIKHNLINEFLGHEISESVFEDIISTPDEVYKKSNELNQIKNNKHQSFATNAMQNRVNLLNQFTQKNISIEYIDKQNQNNQSLGTTVVFVIPIIY